MKKNSVNENLENLCPNFPNCDSEEVLSQQGPHSYSPSWKKLKKTEA